MVTNLAFIRFFLVAVTFGGSSALHTPKELQTKEMIHDRIIQLGHSVQPKSIDPSQVIQLSWQPRFIPCEATIYQLLTRTMYEMILASQWMQMMRLLEGLRKEFLLGLFFPKRTANLCQFCTLCLNHLNKIIITLIRNLWSKLVNLYWQQLFCISQMSVGEENYFFPQSKSDVWSDCTKNSNILRPSRGNAIVFFNLHLNATPDWSSHHSSMSYPPGRFVVRHQILLSEKHQH
ncbi:probable prolyl 4-hydroxylase 12 isoform X1 [Salvia miltiorrhiza]|uniref:probable prolyl 4-hydroxylase 12 isoform X1 n=1 Tax=Salvia miltiorrhiza TaxID=226208 RepID=UPI0025ACDBB7|nr:probable prolyl 4-hydroxylase 12 isoform X1 [Salvia miltiorrhiza]